MKIIKKILTILFLAGILFFMATLLDFDGYFPGLNLNNYFLKNKKGEAEEVVRDRNRNPIIRNESQEDITEREFQGNENDIIALVNQARSEENLPPVQRNEKLMESALLKAEDMKEKNYFEHVSPEGLDPWFFAEKVGYKYKTFGENLAEGFFSANSVHEGWMNSEGHRENILNKDFKEIGAAIVAFEQNGMKSYLLVQHFASQLSQKDLEPKVVCDKDLKKSCEDAKEKEIEVDDVIEKQKDEIKKAKKSDASKEEIEKMKDNLEELEKIDNEIDDYLDQCKDYIKECDKWE